MRKTVLLVCALLSVSALAQAEDKRQVLTVNEMQRNHVLTEMRALLSGTQAILAALAKDDMKAVAEAAKPLGMGMAHKAEDHLKGALPKEFMQLGMTVHQDFDQIAADAETKKDSKHTLKQLSESMAKCTACHEGYQLATPK
jgi:cytochrome c556